VNIRRTLAATALAIVATLAAATGAQASEYPAPSKADRAAMRSANRTCADVQVDRQWAQCVTGAFQMDRTNTRYRGDTPHNVSARIAREETVTWDGGSVVLEAASGKARLGKHLRVTKADKRAMAKANAECIDLSRSDVTWEACTLGAFQWARGRVISDNDYTVVNEGGHYVLRLTGGSHRIR
jgi:hypothetical protein